MYRGAAPLMVAALSLAAACSGSVGAGEPDGADEDGGDTSPGDTDEVGGDATTGDPGPGAGDTNEPPALGPYEPDDGPLAGSGRVVAVSTSAELTAAIGAAQPGDEITLANGTYDITSVVALTRAGTAGQRIFVRAANPHQAIITICADIGFRVDAPYWIFEDLLIRSRCTTVSDHAFQVIGNGSDFILRRNRSQDFFAHVKLNGTGGSWPDRFWAIDNEFRATTPIPADGPFNVLNLDGGDGHVVRRNRFVDIAVSVDRHASSIYLKATTRDALIEQNLVVCLKSLTSVGPTRGIWGGDQTGSGGICDGDCANLRNVNRNNIVMHCQGGSGNRFGLGSSNERDVVYLHHLVHKTPQNFYVGDNPGPVLFKANLLYADFLVTAGGGAPTLVDNTMVGATGMSALFADADGADFTLEAGQALPKIARDSRAPHDFCGNPRAEQTEVGPIDYAHAGAAACLSRIKAMYEAL